MNRQVDSVTVVADRALMKAARERALRERSTLEDEIQKWLEEYVQRDEQVRRALATIDSLRKTVRTGGKRFTREELNER